MTLPSNDPLEGARNAGLVPADAGVRRLGGDAVWSEGPVWLPETGRVRWSDIPGNRILEVDPETGTTSVYRDGVEFTNGRTLDRQGRVIQASHGRRAIERETADGVEILAERWEGGRFNSPNDVIVARDGSIWFSDPPYGILQAHEGHLADPEYGANHVFRLDPATGEVRPVITEFVEEPNGLAFSPDERILYVCDTSAALRTDGSGHHHITAWRVDENGGCHDPRVFADIDDGFADGIRVDAEGRVWSSSESGVLVFSTEGEVIALIPVPEKVGNLCFGGPDGTTLFIAATTGIYAVATTTTDAAAER